MALNPTVSLATPILTYATPAQRKAVGNENEEDKARPLPPVEQSDQGEATANRKKDPNRIEEELPEYRPSKQARQQASAKHDEGDVDDDAQREVHFSLHQDPPVEDYPSRPIVIDDLLMMAAKGLSNKASDGEN